MVYAQYKSHNYLYKTVISFADKLTTTGLLVNAAR